MTPRETAAADAACEEEVLMRRAAQLAQPMPALLAEAGGVEALDFEISGQHCLLELQWVREVRRLQELLPVPLAAPALLGLMHLRGRLLPVFDVAGLLGIPAARTESPSRLLVLGRDAPLFAIAATALPGLRQVPASETERRSQPLNGLRPALVRGLTAEGHLLLEGERLLAIHKNERAQPAASAAPAPNVAP